MMECLGELAELRGFKYYVELEDSPMFSRPNQGSNWDTVIGFTNNPAPDIACEFPEYFKPDRRYVVKPADLQELFSQLAGKSNGK